MENKKLKKEEGNEKLPIERNTLMNNAVGRQNVFSTTVHNFSDSELNDVEVINPSKFMFPHDGFLYLDGDLFCKNFKISSATNGLTYQELNARLFMDNIKLKGMFIHTTIKQENGSKLILTHNSIFNNKEEQEVELIIDPYQFSDTSIYKKCDFMINHNSSIKLHAIKPNCKITLYFYF